MGTESREICRWTKWTLFAAFLFTIPVPFYMFVVGGIVPMFFILFFFVQGLIGGLTKFTAEGFGMLAILLAHVVVLGGLLYVGASGIHWFLFRVLPQRHAKIAVFVFIVAFFILASTLDLYRLPGHNYTKPANILRVIKELAI